jgi:hypothetical protein
MPQCEPGQILKPAQDTFWGGYAENFCDPDGHLWEIVWNPHILPPNFQRAFLGIGMRLLEDPPHERCSRNFDDRIQSAIVKGEAPA